MTLPDPNLQESSKSTLIRDEYSGRGHPKDARKSNPMTTTKGHYSAVQSPSGRPGVLEKSARPARDRRWISSVQFSHARKSKEINGGSLSWPLQDTCATSCPSLEA